MGMGSMEGRIKTDVRMSGKVMKEVDDLATVLGIPKNALFTMAVCRMVVELSPMVKGVKKRDTLLRNVESVFQKSIEDARKAA